MVLRTVLVWVLLTVGTAAQTAQLTVDAIYGPEGWTRFHGRSEATIGWVPKDSGPWLDEGHFLWPADGASGSSWVSVDALKGERRPLFTYAQLDTALTAAGVPGEEARRQSRRRPSIFNPQRSAFLLTVGDDLYRYDIPTAAATRLTNSPGTKTDATFSPDGRAVAFIKNHNLYVTGSDPMTKSVIGSDPLPAERALTTDGNAELLNGRLDWVYSEELYGRGNHRAYWWSPDSSHIAFIQLNEQPVPEYTLVDDIPYHPILERWDYPKAGDPNPVARLGIAAARADVPIRWVDTSKYSDFLIVAVGWTPDSRSVVHQIQDRQQTWLDLNRSDRAMGTTTTLFRETSKAWVERWQDDSADPYWLADGSFLWLSERTGWRHLYHYKADGSLIGPVTTGEWENRFIHGASDRWVYFSATERSPLELHLYRIRIDGTGMERLSSTAGRHKPFFNPSRALYLDSWSDVATPPQVRLHRVGADAALRVVEANPVTASKDYGFSTPEFVQVNTRDGFPMEAMMIKPPNFDPSQKYPVYQFTYAGPHAQQVMNGWGWSDHVYLQLLAQRGIIVWICDNRTASGKGVRSAWPLYKNFGELELRDIDDGLAWLKRQPYVDGSRIGISGVSFGGFMTLYALTHGTSFRMGIAEGAVADWRNYDTIYTERYLGLPQDNPDAYRKSSPRFSAASLRGELLLIHSTMDDNVHPQNTMQFAYELQKAGKPFQLMLYSKSAHGVSDPQLAPHMRRMMLDFTLKNLLQ